MVQLIDKNAYAYEDLDFELDLHNIIVSMCGEMNAYDQEEDENYSCVFQSNSGRG